MADQKKTESPEFDYGRRHDLDALRAVAMLLGIVLHAALSFLPFPWVVQDSRQNTEFFGFIFSSIHGFRMPLFFLLSGFFTAMLWRKRGLRYLVWHRFRRIFIPCVVSVFTIGLLMFWVYSFVARSADNTEQFASNIWTASRLGNNEELQKYISQEDFDLDKPDPKIGATPLSYAVIYGHQAAVELLLQSDANPNARNKDKNTPLHSAAFLGRAEIAKTLLDAGADPRLKNAEGQTPGEVLLTDWQTSKFILDWIKIEMTREKLDAGREKVAALLPEHSDSANPAERLSRRSGESALLKMPIFHHMWFLWFLCLLLPVFVVFVWLLRLLRCPSLPRWVVLSPFRILWLIPLTMIPLWYMSREFPVFGPDTAVNLTPPIHILGYYALFFGFGVLYFESCDEIGQLGRRWNIILPVSLFVLFPIAITLLFVSHGARGTEHEGLLYALYCALEALYTWLMCFGLIGLFRKFLGKGNKGIRYISDASYWIYLAHLPLVILLQFFMKDWAFPSAAKWFLIILLTTAILLLLYRYAVRYTFIGTMLNGKKRRNASTS